MPTEHHQPPGLRKLVYAQLPADAAPTDTVVRPISRYVLENAEGNVVEMVRQRVMEEFGETPHVVLTLRDGDLDPATDGELVPLLEDTDGGLLVFGVAYRLEGKAQVTTDEACPECGATGGVEISRADAPDAYGRVTTLLECQECGTVWDSWVKD